MAASASAQTSQEVNLCNFESLTPRFIERVQFRPDFEDLLLKMVEVCPDAALAFADAATAAIREPVQTFGDETDNDERGGSTSSGGGSPSSEEEPGEDEYSDDPSEDDP